MDPTENKDWQIAQEAMKYLPTPDEWIDKLGIQKDEMIPH
jgi:formate--tetrahydrofolate ligase